MESIRMERLPSKLSLMKNFKTVCPHSHQYPSTIPIQTLNKKRKRKMLKLITGINQKRREIYDI